jgi:ribosomal protein S18 acetylase RimI-like enzyme
MNGVEQMAAIEIRPVDGPREVEACARMMAGSEPWITLGRDYPGSLETLSASGKEVYVAAAGGDVLGFVILNLQGAFAGYIQTICVAPGRRGLGIGSRLIAFAEGRVFKDHPNLFICVSSFNPGAERLYRRLGYELVGELRDYIVRGHSEILLRKSIAPLREFRKPATGPRTR